MFLIFSIGFLGINFVESTHGIGKLHIVQQVRL